MVLPYSATVSRISRNYRTSRCGAPPARGHSTDSASRAPVDARARYRSHDGASHLPVTAAGSVSSLSPSWLSLVSDALFPWVQAHDADSCFDLTAHRAYTEPKALEERTLHTTLLTWPPAWPRRRRRPHWRRR